MISNNTLKKIAGAILLNRGQTEIKREVAVPEPGSLALLAAALLGMLGLRRSMRRRAL